MIKHEPIGYSLLPLSIAHSLTSQEFEIKPLRPTFQSRQFLWQNLPVRLPTLEVGFLLGLEFAKMPSSAN